MPPVHTRLALISAVFLLGASPSRAGQGVTILAWSDLHGSVPPGLKVLVDSARAAAEAAKRPLIALDGGDVLFGSRLAHVTRGVAQTAQMNYLKPDAMILGLGDFAWDRSRLDSLVRVLEFPVLTANLRRNVDDKPIGNRRSVLLERAGMKIGVIGIADPDLDFPERQDKNGDMRVDPEETAVASEVDTLRKAGADLVVLLSNAASNVTAKLAKIDGVDIVLNAHDNATASLEKDGLVWKASVPGGGSTVLRIDIESGDGDSWSATSSTISVPKALPSNAAWRAMAEAHDSLLADFQSRTVGTLKAPWPTTRREGLLGNWMADALRGGTQSDIALVPASWIRKGLPKGRVRVQDLWDAVPPGLNMVSVFTLPGSDVMKYLERQMRRAEEFIFVSGLSCTPDSSMYGGNSISARIGGKPLDKSAYYRIAIPNQLRSNIYDLTGISTGSAGADWTGIWESDMVIDWALAHGLDTELGRVPKMYCGTAPK